MLSVILVLLTAIIFTSDLSFPTTTFHHYIVKLSISEYWPMVGVRLLAAGAQIYYGCKLSSTFNPWAVSITMAPCIASFCLFLPQSLEKPCPSHECALISLTTFCAIGTHSSSPICKTGLLGWEQVSSPPLSQLQISRIVVPCAGNITSRDKENPISYLNGGYQIRSGCFLGCSVSEGCRGEVPPTMDSFPELWRTSSL
jgi:hypothetical protein